MIQDKYRERESEWAGGTRRMGEWENAWLVEALAQAREKWCMECWSNGVVACG